MKKVTAGSGLYYYDKVTPARKLDIFKWLISGGRFGRLYYVETKLTTMMPPQHFNCRCETSS